MWPIIYLFIMISFLIIAIILFYCKYIKLNDMTARKIEITGYVLLFIVLVWEFIIKNLLMDEFYNANWFYLDKKLSYMFMMLEADLEIAAIDKQAVVDGFRSSSQGEYVQIQMTCVNVIESILKILSTILITVGRFQELLKMRNYKK